jgi:hypothetical protein
MVASPDLVVADFTAALANTAPWIWRDRAEHLPDIASLRGLMADHALSARDLRAQDVTRAHRLRPLLRGPFDSDSDSACAHAIDELLAELAPIPRLEHADGAWFVRLRCPSGLAVDDAIASAADALARVLTTDGRARLGHCAHEPCQGVFLDATRNRSRRFCMPQLCGNRANVAAHRRRQPN